MPFSFSCKRETLQVTHHQIRTQHSRLSTLYRSTAAVMLECLRFPVSVTNMIVSLFVALSYGLHTCKSSSLSEAVSSGRGAARVVFIPASVASHYYQFRPIIQDLAARGHQLQVISAARLHTHLCARQMILLRLKLWLAFLCLNRPFWATSRSRQRRTLQAVCLVERRSHVRLWSSICLN